MKYLDTDVISIRELKELVRKLDRNNNKDVYIRIENKEYINLNTKSRMESCYLN